MKKYKSCYVILVLIILLVNTVIYADYTSDNTFTDIYSELWLTDASTKEKMEKSFDDYLNEMWETQYILAPNYAREKIGLSGSIDEQYQQYMDSQRLDYEKGLKVYSTSTNKYLKQYMENSCLEYLLYNQSFWAIPYVSQSNFKILNEDGNVETEKISHLKQSAIMRRDGLEFLSNYSAIEKLLQQENETQVNDIKIIVVDTFFTFLYIDGSNDDYMIRLYKGRKSDAGWIEELECFKLYKTGEVIQKITGYNNKNTNWSLPQDISKEKNIYYNEAEELQSVGLLKGNEKGLDLLKPLTRAEAVTLLIRAMGLEDQTSNYTISQFSDIASDNWASPYAALAKEKGITYGISDSEFAPNAPVTAEQFATFTLRAAGESGFDYTQGIQILIDRGVITEEEAKTMDLFTRGDMAKIVYEMREKGLSKNNLIGD